MIRNHSKTKELIDPSISFNVVTITGISGSGQGVRFTEAIVSTRILPADQDLSFGIQGTDGDGDTTATSTLHIGVVSGDGSYTLTGTGGDDVLAGSSQDDVISGGGGHDLVDYSDDGKARVRVVQTISGMERIDVSSAEGTNFGKGLGSISGEAFEHCRALKSISLPTTMESLCHGAFRGCVKLIDVKLRGAHLDELGPEVFAQCVSLQRIRVPPTIEIVNDGVFCGCIKLVQVDLCNGLKHIEKDVFRGCKSLKFITIPSTVIKIGDSAFYDCEQLKEVKICEGLQCIGRYAFACTSLERYNYHAR